MSGSISDLVALEIPTYSSTRDRKIWLVTLGSTLTRRDVLGVRTPDGEYDLLPLSRVWDMDTTPYEPPMSADDWRYVIMGMRDGHVRDTFLRELAYGIMGHIDDDYVDLTLDEMKDNDMTLTFDTSYGMFQLV